MKYLLMLVCSVGAYAYSPLSQMDLESIYMQDGREPIFKYQSSRMYDWSKAVVVIQDHGQNICTGTLVGDHVIMTNFHCRDVSNTVCNNTTVQFFYEDKAASPLFTAKCVREFANKEALDYWFFEIDNVAPTVEAMSLSKANVHADQMLTVIGHPQGGKKMIDNSSQCKVNNVDAGPNYNREFNFNHQCDTEPGNSGSAVFDRDSGVIYGLHWGGGATTSDPASANLAIPAFKIVEDVRANVPELAKVLNVL